MIPAYEPYARPIPNRSAKSEARSRDRLATATTDAPGTWLKSGSTDAAMFPGPTMPQRTSSTVDEPLHASALGSRAAR